MKRLLANKQILLGVTGGIAAYKSADLVRRLRDAGAVVRVVMTTGAKQFITPLTMQAVSGNPVHDDLFDLEAEAAMGHIELARWADIILVAPATADFMAKLVQGEAGDLLSTLCLASQAPLVIAPAMNQGMWKHTATQTNVQVLQNKAVHFIGPEAGDQACGDVGFGRMSESLAIVEQVSALFATGSMAGKRIVITAGPTHEAIDPVRYISNASSGKMGYALAEAAAEAGADVVLISGPVNLATPPHVQRIDVISAQQMLDAVMSTIKEADIFMGVAAVADYRCKQIAAEKIKKSQSNSLTIELEKNPDILAAVAQVSPRPYVIGFAAETEKLTENARTKLQNKKLDMIIANLAKNSIGQDENEVIVLWNDQQQSYSRMPKRKLARELMKLIGEHHARRTLKTTSVE